MVNKKLKFVSRIIMCGMIMIMAAGVGETVKAANTGSGSVAQPLTDGEYYFSLATYGEREVDFDVTTMRPKKVAGNSYVKGITGDDEAIIIWAVGHDREGFHNFEYCRDCSGGYTYKLYKDSEIYMVNFAYQRGYGYTAIAGQLTTEKYNYIYGRFTPDYDEAESYELQ